ncbi:uncharacterized protein G2W53_014717 [Senna tora]|uniref:Retrotransposon gag domain-containing protein n=1 Tax=Senna tora TaxID=362788 RepID=A0A834WU82_9FABA|nr:uncharacterized protein G2W53_014717 [Senna tora]
MPLGKKKKRVVEASPPSVRGRKRRGRAISHSPVRSPISPSSPESTHFEEAEMAEQNNRNVSDYATPKLDGLQHSIRRPSIQANSFEIKLATIQLLQANGQFGGSPIEDPNNHILNFLEIYDTFKHNGVSDDAIRLRLFPFSLRDKAKFWLQSLPEGSISTWEELAQQFLTKYFPPGKTAKMRNDITSFVLLDNESLYEAWERFKELLRKCPHHGLPKWLQVQTFYNGLSSEIRTSIDAAAGREGGGYGFLGWSYGREGVSRWRGVGEGLGDEGLGSVLVNGKGGGSVGLQWRCEAMVMEVWVVEEEMVWFGEREN